MFFEYSIFRIILKFLVILIVYSQLNDAVIEETFNINQQNKPQQHPAISLHFYNTKNDAQLAKNQLQNHMLNFLEHLQRNLTTSYIFNQFIDTNNTKQQNVTFKLQKISELSLFFEDAYIKVEQFAQQAKIFLEASKNESSILWQKLRQVPVGQNLPSMQVKQQLTNYFLEMEFFHILYTELINEVLEYTLDVLNAIEKTFRRYVGIQQEMLNQFQTIATDECCNQYMSFLQHWSAQIFKCAADDILNTVYDVYAVTEVNIRHVLQQLEYRIYRIFNCFFLGQFELRCRFFMHPEDDLDKLRAKLDELQIFFDVRAKHGLVSSHNHRQERSQSKKNIIEGKPITKYENIFLLHDRCIPFGFPEMQMTSQLQSCFDLNFIN